MKTNDDPNKDSTLLKNRILNPTSSLQLDNEAYENEVKTITNSKKERKKHTPHSRHTKETHTTNYHHNKEEKNP